MRCSSMILCWCRGGVGASEFHGLGCCREGVGSVEVGEEYKVVGMSVYTLLEVCLGVGRLGRLWVRRCDGCGWGEFDPDEAVETGHRRAGPYRARC